MKNLNKLFLVTLLTFSLSACSMQSTNKEQKGTLLGGLLGGVLGSNIGEGKGQTAAIIGGTLLGSYFGNSIGKSLDKADQAYMYRAQNTAYATPIGHQINWHNPESGHSGSILPVREGTSARGEYCREFKQMIYIDGNQHQAYGTACKQTDGTWRITQ
jgi:surface antigen